MGFGELMGQMGPTGAPGAGVFAGTGGGKRRSADPYKGKLKAPKRAKDMLLADLQAPGYEATKGMRQATARQAEEFAAQGMPTGEMARQAMAGGLAGDGRAQEMIAQLGEASAEAGAQAASESDRLYKQIEEAKRAELVARLAQQQDRARENSQHWSKLGVDAVGAVGGAITGGITGGGSAG